jgi:hypothetical protein
MRVNISATGSVIISQNLSTGYLASALQRASYQLALTTPGICPLSASSRKQIRHNPKRRM